MPDIRRGQRKVRVGTVVSDKMQQTVVVAVERVVAHSSYGRRVKQTKRLKAHDANGDCHVGDRVRVAETRPLSRDKHWRVVEVIERAK